MDEASLLRALHSGLAGHDYALIGAAARNAWAPPRATTDVDLSLAASASAIAALDSPLQSLGYVRVRQQQVDPSDPLPDIIVFRAPRQPQLDVLMAKTPFEREALARAVPCQIAGEAVPVATPEDLIVYKLIADRERDRDDIRAVVRTQSRAGRSVDWAYVETWAARWGISDRAARARRDSEG